MPPATLGAGAEACCRTCGTNFACSSGLVLAAPVPALGQGDGPTDARCCAYPADATCADVDGNVTPGAEALSCTGTRWVNAGSSTSIAGQSPGQAQATCCTVYAAGATCGNTTGSLPALPFNCSGTSQPLPNALYAPADIAGLTPATAEAVCCTAYPADATCADVDGNLASGAEALSCEGTAMANSGNAATSIAGLDATAALKACCTVYPADATCADRDGSLTADARPLSCGDVVTTVAATDVAGLNATQAKAVCCTTQPAVAAVAAGMAHTCALLRDTSVRCFGYGIDGQLGDGTATSSPVPVPVTWPGGALLTGVASISAGDSHTCARLNDGTALCWGPSWAGQLGDGTSGTNRLSLAAVTLTQGGPPLTGVAGLAAGEAHTCARLNDGTALCWGSNWAGQLGDGSTRDSSVPVPVKWPGGAPLTGVASIAAGGAHTCARLNDGTALCWGSNWAGQLGDGSTGDSSVPVPVKWPGGAPLTGVASIAAGGAYTCATLVNGTAACWGWNGYGMLGNNDASGSSQTSPVAVFGRTGVTLVAGSGSHTCIMASGEVACFGLNYYGQLGVTDTAGSFNPNPTPLTVPGLSGVAGVATGSYHTCAWWAGGAVACFGYNYNGQLGRGSTNTLANPTPEAVRFDALPAFPAGATCGDTNGAADGAPEFNCAGSTQPFPNALDPAGNITDMTWAQADSVCCTAYPAGATCTNENGDGAEGDLLPCDGTGMANSGSRTTPISNLGAAAAKAACCTVYPADATCADRDGNLTPGAEALSCEGTDMANPGNAATSIADLGTAAAKAACCTAYPADATCADRDGNLTPGAEALSCGNLVATANAANTTIAGLSAAAAAAACCTAPVPVVAVNAGRAHTCALLRDTSVRCFGYGIDGQLGDGTATSSPAPVPVKWPGGALLTGVASISAGDSYTCARLANGTVACWGRSEYGQLGGGNYDYKPSPAAVTLAQGGPPLTGVAGLAAGGFHTCARLNDGTALCWGGSWAGQLGDGTSGNARPSPATVMLGGAPLTGVAGLAAGEAHTCARLNDGTALCWGSNWAGQLGDGSTGDSSVPVPVKWPGGAPLTGVASIAAGVHHTCATLVNGTAACWGWNGYGMLGSGVISNNQASPVIVSGRTGVTLIAGGLYHTCIIASGKVACFGNNYNGQLGVTDTAGSFNPNPTPLTVPGLSGVAGVATGSYHTCAWWAGGAVACFGNNNYGQLGSIISNPNPTPGIVRFA
ncbi:UVR8 [Scenedesmus sp. PABB004]|nr:UVR8 [Scenedesmus sp. PABB004]